MFPFIISISIWTRKSSVDFTWVNLSISDFKTFKQWGTNYEACGQKS